MANIDEKYYTIPERNSQIGFTLIERLEKGRKELFYHTSKDVIELALQHVKKGVFDPKKYPAITESQAMIVKFEEKHGDLYYVYNSREEFYKIFLEVLISRYDQGWYNYTMNKPKQEVTMTLEEISALTDEKLKAFQYQRFEKYERDMREYNEFVQLQKETEQAYKNKDAKLAYFVLLDRKGGEYEGFEIIEPQRVDS